MNKPTGIQRRRSVRFRPSPETLAMIDTRKGDFDNFKPTIFALVSDESSTGVGIVAITNERLMTGENIHVQVGDLAPVLAEIRWRTDLDQDVLRLGLMYLTTT